MRCGIVLCASAARGSARSHFGDCLRLEAANDLDRLRFDPAFKLACGRLLDSGLGTVLVADHLALGETLRACAIISLRRVLARATWAQAIIEALRHNAARRPLAR
jgi:hypothetical protein